MTPEEESRLRSVYRMWTDERLTHVFLHQQHEFKPEVFDFLRKELERRGINSEALRASTVVAARSAVDVPRRRGSWFLPTRSVRLQYLARWLIWVVVLIGVGETIMAVGPYMLPAYCIWVFLAVLYRVVGMDIPRIKNAGMSPGLLFLFLVPLANLVIQTILFVAPPEEVRVN